MVSNGFRLSNESGFGQDRPEVRDHYQLRLNLGESSFHCLVSHWEISQNRIPIDSIARLYWSFRRDDRSWESSISCSFYQSEIPGDCFDCRRNNKLVRLRLFFSYDIHPLIASRSPESWRVATETYHLAKELCDLLEASSVDCWSDSMDTTIYDDDPRYEGRLFRFSSNGTQVPIPAYEERINLTRRDFDAYVDFRKVLLPTDS